MPKKMKKVGKPSVHTELSGFDIKINSFGEMETNYKIDNLNEFLNENINDKKLIDKNIATEEE